MGTELTTIHLGGDMLSMSEKHHIVFLDLDFSINKMGTIIL